MTLTSILYLISGAVSRQASDSTDRIHKIFHDFTEATSARAFNDYIYDSNADHTALGPDWGAVLLIVIILTILICLALSLFKGARLIEWIRKKFNLRVWFVIALIMGFFVYDIGMCTGEPISLLTNIPMAILHAIGMFALSSDVSEIHDPFYHNWIFMGVFSLAHSLAALVSMSFIIRTFGFNISAKFQMWRASLKKDFRGDTFVIWGANEATYNLVESINKKFSNNKDNYRIIVVRTNESDNDDSESTAGIDRILDFLTIRNTDLERIENLNCLTTSTYNNFLSTKSIGNIHKHESDILGKQLHLRSLKKIVNNSYGPLYMIFMSEDEHINITSTNLLLRDISINNVVTRFDRMSEDSGTDSQSRGTDSQRPEVAFLFHARYNSVHRVLEDTHARSGIRVSVIDSSHLCVEMLKSNTDLQPVNFVKVEKDASVSSAFNSLVIGFDEVGRDMVKFLYEFGAFVKTGSNEENVMRSEFHLQVVDKNMSDIAGGFLANNPAIRPSMPFIPGEKNPDALIELNETDCRSAEFFIKIEKSIPTLNYIVVATGDDDLNMSIGIRIFKAAARYSTNMDNFCILIRVHNDDDGHNQMIIDHYNKLWAAQKKVWDINDRINLIRQKEESGIRLTDEEEKLLRNWDGVHQTEFRNEDDASLPLCIFGTDKEIYTYLNIIDNTFEKEAIKYKEKYEAATKSKPRNASENARNKEESDKAWHKEFRKLMYLDENFRDFHPSYGDIMSLRRKQRQDIANSLHGITKNILVKEALKAGNIENIKWTDVTRPSSKTVYSPLPGRELKSEIIDILDNLARTEHLRWSASHEILGYVGIGDIKHKDEVRQEHGCITDWQNLDTVTKSYDYNVVDVTLGIIDPDNPIQRSKE